MGECICSGCRNLKSIINDNGEIVEYKCEFSFPSDMCTSCEDGECDAVCSNYVSDEEEGAVRTVKCMKCGKELTQACSDDNNDGEVYCISCYLDNLQ